VRRIDAAELARVASVARYRSRAGTNTEAFHRSRSGVGTGNFSVAAEAEAQNPRIRPIFANSYANARIYAAKDRELNRRRLKM